MSESIFSWIQAHRAEFSGDLLFDEPLKKHTYYRIGGPARVLAFPKSEADLKVLSRALSETGAPYFILGAGSNVLVSDNGFDGLVIRASRLNLEIAQVSDTCLRTGGSVAISSLLRRAAQEGWAGLEFLTGVPGSVGGAITMNAGTHLGEAQSAVRSVTTIELENGGARRTYSGDELKFQYRKNLFLPRGAVVTEVEWGVRREEPARVKAAIDETLARRKATQPIDYPSCGSVFKNPKGQSPLFTNAWQVVDKLGLRGHRIGEAQISEKHSNFIVNLGNAKAADVRGLIDLAKSRALTDLGIRLEEEVIYVGKF